MKPTITLDEEFKPSNRDRKMASKKGRGYCYGCDVALVSDGSKCPICGKLHGDRKLLKSFL